MEILKIKSAIIYKIDIKANINKNNLHKLSNSALKLSCISITHTQIKYSNKISKDYLSSVTKKKFKLNEEVILKKKIIY